VGVGGAALGLVRPEIGEAAARLHRPEPRIALGSRLRGLAHAAIDVSDGLAGDLAHILERSRVGAVVQYDLVPRPAAFRQLGDPALEKDCVLSGGDDYELLFAAPAARRGEVQALSRELALPLSLIGRVEREEGKLAVLDGAGRPMSFRGGFDHFAR